MNDTKKNRKNYNPKWWGPSAWRFLHTLAEGMPEELTDEESESIKTFTESIPFLLPCAACRNHSAENIKNLNFSYNKRDEIIENFNKLHNSVNIMLNKDSSIKITDSDSEKEVKSYKQSNEKNNETFYTKIIPIICIIVFCLIIFSLSR